jgi:hypothetical protein
MGVDFYRAHHLFETRSWKLPLGKDLTVGMPSIFDGNQLIVNGQMAVLAVIFHSFNCG